MQLQTLFIILVSNFYPNKIYRTTIYCISNRGIFPVKLRCLNEADTLLYSINKDTGFKTGETKF
jgi:hypothetical protein